MKLAEFYAAHSDPGVVSCLVDNYATPKRVLRGLRSEKATWLTVLDAL
jgi:hypothetical protein